MNTESIKTFYDSISKKYDWFFSDWNKIIEEQMLKLMPIFKKNNVRKVLDCACGTGIQTIALLKSGFEVIASDLSKNMLDQAVINAKREGFNLKTIQADFRYLTQKISGKFDSVICMGNSLPHLFTDKDIKMALLNMYQLIKENGLLIIDKSVEIPEEKRFMPVRVNAEYGNNLVTILYVMDYFGNINRFNVIFIIQNSKTKEYSFETYSLDYIPLKKEKLIKFLHETGFSNIETKESSDFIIFIAYKK